MSNPPLLPAFDPDQPDLPKITKRNADKVMTYLKKDLADQFVAVYKGTSKPVEMPDGQIIYKDQKKLIDTLMALNIKEPVSIMVRHITPWRLQSSLRPHYDSFTDTTDDII